MNKFRKYLTDISLVYTAAIWGSTFYLVKDTLNYIHPVALLAYRFSIAALILAVFLLFKKINIFKNFSTGFVTGILLWAIYTPQTIGLQYTTASNSGFITGLFVVFLPIFSFIFAREIPSMIKIAAVIISITGLWVLTGGLSGMNFGDMLTLITALACAAHVFVVDRFVKNQVDPYILCFQQFFIVGILSFVLAFIFRVPLVMSAPRAGWIIIFLALFPTLSAFVIQLSAQRYTAPLKVSFIFALEPVFAAIFAWTLGGEVFVTSRAIGGLMIFIAILMYDFSFKELKSFLFSITKGHN
ncbi:MAG TPA: DMT family transporter [Dehalococcoidia bacterium]|nr:DMT family transporter [Dehalococcoidia bacterium]